ncbi:hypothetical protein [Nannocystis punicea]|uniref:DUF2383 domain-containing protein n=1 Tax=Nannocystis punicea TaxID=2995304 RepID=A0ABY7H2G5_9BACT|nr:hypothetical protein [Nannocystis poenicansa]WAS93332.1 hypothetical protein O0S08_44880 [Nannocystis poenicansa]
MRPTVAAAPASMTPDELAETRRKAGFQDGATLEAERAEARERVARSYVRAHLAAYREVVKALRGNLAEIERAARRWLRTNDPQRAYERWRGVSRRRADRVAGLYQHVADDGFDGGQTQRLLADAFRRWEELREDLGGEVAADARFSALVVELRDALTAVSRVLDEIEHDEELASEP